MSEPKNIIPMKAGDPRVLINGEPVKVDFRIISESNYQYFQNEINRLHKATTNYWAFGILLGFLIGAAYGMYYYKIASGQ